MPWASCGALGQRVIQRGAELEKPPVGLLARSLRFVFVLCLVRRPVCAEGLKLRGSFAQSRRWRVARGSVRWRRSCSADACASVVYVTDDG